MNVGLLVLMVVLVVFTVVDPPFEGVVGLITVGGLAKVDDWLFVVEVIVVVDDVMVGWIADEVIFVDVTVALTTRLEGRTVGPTLLFGGLPLPFAEPAELVVLLVDDTLVTIPFPISTHPGELVPVAFAADDAFDKLEDDDV